MPTDQSLRCVRPLMSAASEPRTMSSSKASTLLSAIVSVNITLKTHKWISIDMVFNLGPFCPLKHALEAPQTAPMRTEIRASRSTKNLAIIAMQREKFVRIPPRQRRGAQDVDRSHHRYFISPSRNCKPRLQAQPIDLLVICLPSCQLTFIFAEFATTYSIKPPSVRF